MIFRALVLYSGFLLFLSSVVLFVAGARLRRAHWLASLALVALVSVAAWAAERGVIGAAPPLGETLAITLVSAALLAAWLETWNAAGHAAWLAVLGSAATFLAYGLHVVIVSRLGPWSVAFALVLLALQAATLTLLAANMFEILDVMCRVSWPQPTARPSAAFEPKVSLHVPIHSEPPDLVIETLDALAALDYPDFEVLVIDNNTADEALWRPVEAHCHRLGPRFRFFHLLPWPGYKSGALNFALARTAPDAEVIGVVDADYVVEARFLRDLVGWFADGTVGFVQTPQDYRDHVARGRYGRALYLAYLYFFEVSMAARSAHDAIIYAGTMGLIRRSALVDAGGWNEWCITEDAELSLRLLAAGHRSVYVPRTYGRGIMPIDYAGLKRQRFRWAFGGMQILRAHARLLLNPFARTRLSWAQRFAYLNGGFQWLNDPLTLAFTAVLFLGTGALLAGRGLQSQPLAGAVILMPPLFILFALTRFLWAFKLRARCSLREAADALTVLLGLTWVVALACLRGLVGRQGVFLRTPKQADRPTAWDALRIAWIETAIGVLSVAAAAALAALERRSLWSATGMVVAMLVWQAVVYLSALRSSVWNYVEVASAPRRWRESFRSLGHRTGRFVTEGRVAAVVLVSVLAIALLFQTGRRRAPLMERVEWADPLSQFLPARAFSRPADPAARAATVLVLEADAAERSDVGAALTLWAPDGVIVDANGKPEPGPADPTWVGADELRRRYVTEFQERRYESLKHLNLSVSIQGDKAEITNDLAAVFETRDGFKSVDLPKSDRWLLRRDGDAWRIVRLEVNRRELPRPPVRPTRAATSLP